MSTVFQSVWRSRVVLLSAFGLVGVGAVIGAGSVYLFYFKKKLDDLFQIQSVLHVEVQNLRKDVDKFNQGAGQSNGAAGGSDFGAAGDDFLSVGRRSIGGLARKTSNSNKRSVRFKDGYETADEDEYVTASSDSEGEGFAKAAGSRYNSKCFIGFLVIWTNKSKIVLSLYLFSVFIHYAKVQVKRIGWTIF